MMTTLTLLLSKMSSQKHNGKINIIPFNAHLFFLQGRLLNVQLKKQSGFKALFELFQEQFHSIEWSAISSQELFLIEEKFDEMTTEEIIIKLVDEQKVKKVNEKYLTSMKQIDDNLVLLE